MNIVECEQGTDEWFAERLGVLTASQVAKVVTATGKKSTSAAELMLKLNTEYLMGERLDTHTSQAMQRGNELEPLARSAYELISGFEVAEVGFIKPSTKSDDINQWCGVSPDGVVFSEQSHGWETKCPMETTHLKYLLDGKLPTTYLPQVQYSMWVTGLERWDFMSYSERFNPMVLTIEPDLELHKIYDELIAEFIEKMLAQREKLQGLI